MRTIRIFVSSPGDVHEERDVAFKIIARIANDPMLRDEVTIKAIGWDRPDSRVPMLGWITPQEAINRGLPLPSQCDIVAVILWMRFGTPLPDEYKKPDGSPYLSGTEYEHNDARRGVVGSTAIPPRPQLVVYRRPQIALSDTDPDFDEKRTQKQRVGAFFSAFRMPNGALRDGINDYTNLADFETKFENDIRWLIKQILDAHEKSDDQDTRNKPQPDSPQAWQPGHKFGPDHRYTLIRELGDGGNGTVWLAEEALPDGSTAQVAVKTLKPEISRDTERVERFKKELSVVKSKGRADKHIAPIEYFEVSESPLYYVMPLMSGGTLREVIDKKAFTLDQALVWLDQIGIALDFMQRRVPDFVHRDVKPENMLFSDKDREMLYLSDFGLAISPTSERFTQGGKPAGTGRYMAPEQWRHEPLSPHTDLYALGILTYELLTGHLPYDPAQGDYLLSKAHCEASLPTDLHLPDEVLRILQKACAKLPTERYPSAAAFLDDLRNWKIDPANLTPKITAYLDKLSKAILKISDDLIQDPIPMDGEQTTKSAPSLPQEEDDFGLSPDHLLDRKSELVNADFFSRNSESTEFVENVRERLLQLDRAVLIGEPGTGKSWMLRRLALDYRERWKAASPEQHTEPNMIPVLLELNTYKGGSFTDFVKSRMSMLAPYHDQLRREGRLVLLCDALNEMPRGNGQLDELVKYLSNVPYFIISCRIRDYQDSTLTALKPLEQVRLRELEIPAIREFLRRQFTNDTGVKLWGKIGGSEELLDFWREEQADPKAFWDAKTERFASGRYWWQVPQVWHDMHRAGARLILLCRNPYMARLLTEVYRGSGDLPSSRTVLFGRFVDELLIRESRVAERRGEIFPAFTDIRAALTRVAERLQEMKETVIPRTGAVSAVGRSEADRLIQSATDAGILNDVSGESEPSLKFAHQLLQEYFACQVMFEALEADEQDERRLDWDNTKGYSLRARPFFEPNWWEAGLWRETAAIFGEFLGEGATGVIRAARWLAPINPELAIEVIERNGLTINDVAADVKERCIARAKPYLLDLKIHPRGRAACGRVLGLLRADDRPGVLDFNGLGNYWCKVLAGDYLLGDNDEPDNPKHLFTLDKDLYMARYPVTYSQFQMFLDDENGYANPEWWRKLDMFAATQREEGAQEQAFKYWNSPRESVSWYEAMAFCQWLSERLGYSVRLPTEDEWEAAARGMDERLYPHLGDFNPLKGNSIQTGIGMTSAVGIFPDGASPYGVLDMSGNVLDWMLATYDNRSSRPFFRVPILTGLRGGSWYDDSDYARAVYRNHSSPDVRNRYVGLRLVCADPILHSEI